MGRLRFIVARRAHYLGNIAAFGFLKCRPEVGRIPHLGPALRARADLGRQAFKIDLVAAQDKRALDRIFKLADVAAPLVVDQRGHGLWRDRLFGRVEVPGRLGAKMFGEQRDVLAAVAQRGKRYLDHVQAVKKVLAKSVFPDLFFEIFVGGGNYPGIEFYRNGRPDRRNLMLLQRAQQLDLQADRHFADLVEKERAAGGRTKQPFFVGYRPRKRTFCMPEKLALEQGFGQGAAVDGQKRLTRRVRC